MKEVIICYGHENVRAAHRSTLEFTTDSYLTPRGDCILCIKASKGLRDLSPEFKKALREGRKLLVRIRVDNLMEEVVAYGDRGLTFESGNSMIIRKSTYTDGRTLAVRANKAARDIDRRIVEKLRNPEQMAVVELIVLE